MLALLCLLLVVFGVWLRIQELSYPPEITWDEGHFVDNARNYLAGYHDLNDHPPLGKLIIAASMHLFGDNSTAWRVPPLLFGLVLIVLAYPLGRTLFGTRLAGLIAVAFFAADGFLISYSRVACLDMFLTVFLTASFLCALRARSWLGYVGACLFAGLALSVKFSGIVSFIPIVYFAVSRRHFVALLALAIIPLVYYAQFAFGLGLTSLPTTPRAVWIVTRFLHDQHAALTQWTHPLTSPWYSWLLPTKPIVMRYDVCGDQCFRVLSTFGHPGLWWTGSLMIIICTVRLVWNGVASHLHPAPSTSARPNFFRDHATGLAYATLAWWLPIAPWIVSRRDAYIYHYLPAYPWAVLLVAGLVAWFYRLRPRVTVALLAIFLSVAVYYAPIWGQLPIDRRAVVHRLFFKSWR